MSMTGHIFIYSAIGRSKGEVSFENINQQLNQNKASEDLVLHIISPGGDVFEGEAIYNALKNSGKNITTHIEGTCASIATLIAAAGSTMVMNTTARFMIHNPKIPGLNQMADSRDLRHVADQLDQIKTLLINVYNKKTTLGEEKLWELYDNETWLTAKEAKEMGFVDEVKDAIKAVATIDLTKIKMEQKDTGLVKFFKNLLGLTKFKNEFTETLADGRTVIIMSEDEDWTGKQVVLEDGSALEDGTFELKSKKTITVAGGIITQTAAVEAAKPDEMDNRIKELQDQLAEAMAQKETAEAAALAAQTQATAAEARNLTLETRVTEIENKFLLLQEERSKTVGKLPIENKGPVNKVPGEREFDPMAEDLGMAYITSRPSNFNRK